MNLLPICGSFKGAFDETDDAVRLFGIAVPGSGSIPASAPSDSDATTERASPEACASGGHHADSGLQDLEEGQPESRVDAARRRNALCVDATYLPTAQPTPLEICLRLCEPDRRRRHDPASTSALPGRLGHRQGEAQPTEQ